jgi:hypothetical protein
MRKTGTTRPGPGDLDVSDQRLDERLALGVSARADDLVDVVSNLAERGGRRWRRYIGELACKLVAAGA